MFDFKHPDLVVTETDWNSVTYEMAATSFSVAYCASKKFAEKAFWEFGETVKPNFSLTTVSMSFVLGPAIHQVEYPKFGSSLEGFYHSMAFPAGETKFMDFFPSWLDVRDAAKIHVVVFEDDALDGNRLLPIAGMATDQAIVEALHKYRPEEAKGITEGESGSFKPDEYFKFDSSKTQNKLKFEYIPYEKMVLDTFDSINLLKKLAETKA